MDQDKKSPRPRPSVGTGARTDKQRDKRKPAWRAKRPSQSGKYGSAENRHGSNALAGTAPPTAETPLLKARDDDEHLVRLFGLHPVAAALNNSARKPLQLYATENAERRLGEMVGGTLPPVERVSPRALDRALGSDTVHQGVLLETTPLPEPNFEDLAAAANGRPLIVLDQVTDPHNVGAILRSAAVFGAAGLIMTRRHSPPLNGVLAKSASGALELIPVGVVGNLARSLVDLKTAGFQIVGLDGAADVRLETLDWQTPTAIVLGAEGKGLRELTRETCDRLARITTDTTLASLNVSNAAAVALHCAALGRLGASTVR